MQKALLKYKIGLAAIGFFVLVLFVIVLVQASGAKQDNETYDKAQKIATKLDTYTLSNPLPASFKEAGITDVPDTVTYERLSDTKYKFCVRYNSDSSGFSASEVSTGLLTGSVSDPYKADDTSESSYLYVDYTHHKGNNCQTIKSYSSSYYNDSPDTSGCVYDYNNPDYTAADKAYNDCLDNSSSTGQ